MKKILSVLAALLLIMSFFSAAVAEVVKPNEDFWYYDEAYVLSDSTKGEIFYANQRLSDACGAEIVVVAVNNTGKLSLEDYTYTLFNEWGIGGESYLGFLLVMDIGNDDYYAMTGTKLEGYIDGAAVQELLDTYLEPDFAKQNYDAGVRKFFEAVYAEVVDQLNLDLSVEQGIADYRRHIAQQEKQTRAKKASSYDSTIMLYDICIVLIIVLMIVGCCYAVTHSDQSESQYDGEDDTSDASNDDSEDSHRPNIFIGVPPPPSHHGPSMRNRSGSSRPSSTVRSSGGSSRPSSPGRSSSGGGFGGASRHSGGGSRGPSTRGGGAGRGSRR